MDKVVQELDNAITHRPGKKGDFSRIHALPHSGADVPDDIDARLVVLAASIHTATIAATQRRRPQRLSWNRGKLATALPQYACVPGSGPSRLQDLDEAAASLFGLGIDPGRTGSLSISILTR